jgi:two-component system LytT family response regulator
MKYFESQSPTSMKTAIIIDDEARGRQALRQKLEYYCPGVALVGEAGSGEAGMALIARTSPDIVFLDIEMPGMNGFEMLQQLKARDFHLVFTTAYDQYAIRAIKFAAFDYLLKPVDVDELRSAVDRILGLDAPQHLGPRLEALQQTLSAPKAPPRLAVPTLEGISFFDLSDIVFLKADSNYTSIHFLHRTPLLASRTLGDFEEMLPSEMFFRPHNSYLVNLQHVSRYLKGDGGQVEMSNGEYVDVSRRRKEEFLRIFR